MASNRKDHIIRSNTAGVRAGVRYISFAPEHGAALVSWDNAQRFTAKQAAQVIAEQERLGEWTRGQYRAVLAAQYKDMP